MEAGPRAQYGAAKAAEIFLAGALAQELAPRRIRINTLSPGSILFPGGSWERVQRQQPERFEAFVRDEFPGRGSARPKRSPTSRRFSSPRVPVWVYGAHIPVDGAQRDPSAPKAAPSVDAPR